MNFKYFFSPGSVVHHGAGAIHLDGGVLHLHGLAAGVEHPVEPQTRAGVTHHLYYPCQAQVQVQGKALGTTSGSFPK